MQVIRRVRGRQEAAAAEEHLIKLSTTVQLIIEVGGEGEELRVEVEATGGEVATFWGIY